ncbi:antitermination protein [Serratia liquefaciens]|uniref:antitermination protein Q n=1 Tax=Serratia liquefaciens TaxID=614 RepID=UPI0022B94319|nr:antitermination protein [Serratia liquefaciens]
MNLESALKHFSPKSLNISDSSRATASEALTGTDIMAALGMVEAKAVFGMALCLGKYGVSEEDRQRSVDMLTQFASKKAPRAIKRAAGAKFGRCLRIMAAMAYGEFCRSALSAEPCSCCQGRGLVRKTQINRNELAIEWEENKFSIKNGVWMIKDKFQPPAKTVWEDVMMVACPVCKGKGNISARCRCQGTGTVLDKKNSELQGVPVMKECPKCKGRGFKRVQPSVIHHAVKKLLPELPERTWRYSWKPFYESLLTKCYQEESELERIFSKVTR